MFFGHSCWLWQVLENNYRYKMKYSPDYQGVDTEAVRRDGGGEQHSTHNEGKFDAECNTKVRSRALVAHAGQREKVWTVHRIVPQLWLAAEGTGMVA